MRSRFSKTLIGKVAASLAAITICFAAATAISATPSGDKATRRAERAMRDGDFAQAEKLYRELLAKNPHDNNVRLGLSLALLKQRLIQDAFDHAARVLITDPSSARAHALLGASILAAGGFRESVEEFRTALSLDQDEAIAIAGLAMIDFYENRSDAAIRGLRRATSLDPDEPDYIFNLGQAAARRERYKEAADAYERFLNIAPKTDADRRDRIRGLIDFLRYLGQQSSLYVVAGSERTAITFDATDGRPILLVRINGDKTPLRFVLDTGSGMSVVSENTAKRLGLRAVARGGMARAVGGPGRFEIIYGFLESVEIGDVEIKNVPVYIRHFYDTKTPVDGYIGVSVISKFVTSIDYADRSFTLSREKVPVTTDPLKNPAVGANGIEIPLRTTSSGFLSGEVRLGNNDRFWNFIIDTGASVSVVSEKLAAEDQVSNYQQAELMRVYGAAGITENVKTLILPRVKLGELSQEKINAAVLDLDPVNETAGFRQSGILGANFLKNFRVTFDFQRGIIRLEPVNIKGTGSKPDQAEVVQR
ncbi:MAG TPA: aspartyl protease family protein [Pyrinomonadaceae bacterium]|nr:aspartyl protease family protein [Pyrinomonadaceae bacterium]